MDIEKFRDAQETKIEREVSWIKHRMTWLATFQGLLFATFGLIVQGYSSNNIAQIKTIIIILVLLGILLTAGIFCGIIASGKVIKKINAEWKSKFSEDMRAQFPDLRPTKAIIFLGMVSTWVPPILFITAWLSILFVFILNGT